MPNPNLKNRVVPNSAVDKTLYEKIRGISKETKIPISNTSSDSCTGPTVKLSICFISLLHLTHPITLRIVYMAYWIICGMFGVLVILNTIHAAVKTFVHFSPRVNRSSSTGRRRKRTSNPFPIPRPRRPAESWTSGNTHRMQSPIIRR